jgi:hypothetical protein
MDANFPATNDSLMLEDRPKYPLNAYNLFFRFERERIINGQTNTKVKYEDVIKACSIRNSNSSQKRKHRKTHGKIGFAELARTIALQWKMLDQETKAIFDCVALANKVQYKKELDEWCEKQRFRAKVSKSFEGLKTPSDTPSTLNPIQEASQLSQDSTVVYQDGFHGQSFQRLKIPSDMPPTINPIQEASQLSTHGMTVSPGNIQRDSTMFHQDCLHGRDIAKLKGEICAVRQICIRQATLLRHRQFPSTPSNAFTQTCTASTPHREAESSAGSVDLHVFAQSESPSLSLHSPPELPRQVQLPQATHFNNCTENAVGGLDQDLAHVDPDLWPMTLDDDVSSLDDVLFNSLGQEEF